MNALAALILSVVEGVSEFLPISSTAHLVLASKVMGIAQTDFVKSFEISIQLGAILSVIVLYWRKFLVEVGVLKRVLVAFVPTALVGLLFYSFIKEQLIGNLMVTVAALFIGGLLIIVFEKFYSTDKGKGDIAKMGYGRSLFVGVFQSLSVVPGVSRAAATIFGGMFAGLNRKAAVEFSFLLAVPTMAGATGLNLIKSYQGFTSADVWVMLVGFVGSFLVATATIKLLLAYIERNDFVWFGVYRIVVSVVFYFLYFV